MKMNPYSVTTNGTCPKFTKMKGMGFDMETNEHNPSQHLLPIPTTEVNKELGEKVKRSVMY
jgi:hypothetical protein